mmetsp:Transcript_7914/g.25015  ORF Transcript_7914/g.25015 Transcript_7914/m.25015 type:complete len:85 (+) Transcript_7914:56-310(+)
MRRRRWSGRRCSLMVHGKVMQAKNLMSLLEVADMPFLEDAPHDSPHNVHQSPLPDFMTVDVDQQSGTPTAVAQQTADDPTKITL